jgi:hypothetical protein
MCFITDCFSILWGRLSIRTTLGTSKLLLLFIGRSYHKNGKRVFKGVVFEGRWSLFGGGHLVRFDFMLSCMTTHVYFT